MSRATATGAVKGPVRRAARAWLLSLGVLATGHACGRTSVLEQLPPAGSFGGDAGSDAGLADGGRDAGLRDAGRSDGGRDGRAGDAGRDAGAADAGRDAGLADAGRDAGLADAGRDGGAPDAGPPDAGVAEPGLAQDVIYLHDSAGLFAYAPSSNSLVFLANLSCPGALDLAIDRQGRGFIVAGAALFRVNLQTGACWRLVSIPERLVALSFLPAGALGPSEALVGYGAAAYWEFDPAVGNAYRLGSSTLQGDLVPSGDLAPIDDGGVWLTVKSTSAPQLPDQLVRIDPTNGAVLENLGSIGVTAAWGLATWGGALFAFTSTGQGVRLVLSDGGVQPVALNLPGPPRTFWGAAARPGAGSLRDGGP